jgi:hypothetical protein
MHVETENPDTDTNKGMTDDEFFYQLSAALVNGETEKVDALMGKADVTASKTEEEAPTDTTAEDTTGAAAPEAVTVEVEPEAQSANGTTEDTTQPAVDTAGDPAQLKLEQTIKALQDELHAVKSRANRVDSLQSRLMKMERELAEREKAAKAAEAAKPTKAQEHIEKLREIDPDLAETLALMADEFKGANTAATQPQATDDLGLEEELARVERVHPDVYDVLPGGRLRQHWDYWKSLLGPEHRAMAESDRAEEFSMAISAFKHDIQFLTQQNQQQQTTQQTATTTDTSAQPSPQAQATAAARERKLAATTSTKGVANKPVTGQVDPNSAFSELSQSIAKENGILS